MNSHLLNQRRRELAVSRRQLGRSAGVSTRLIELLEDSDTQAIHDAVPVGTVRALERALGLDAAALLQDDQPENPETAGADAAVTSNVLLRVDQPITKAHLATALDWNLARLDRALASLGPALAAAGLALREDSERITVVPALDPRAQQAAASIKAVDAEHDTDALALIYRAWRKGSRWGRPNTLGNLPEAQRRLARSLLVSHILEIDQRDELDVSTEIYKCLQPAQPLDEKHTIGRY